MGILKILAVAATLGYGFIVLLAWAGQNWLLFHPRPPSRSAGAPPGWIFERVVHTTADGTRLVGLLARPSAERGPLVIYFGGNAEEVTEYARAADASYGSRAVLFVNYRGYGESGGTPGESALVADSIELYDWAARRGDVDRARIAVHGRSLGTGVAVQLAAARPVRCVVLTSPYASMRELAAGIYPWLPVKLLLRHAFDSLALASRLRVPALFLVGEADDLIPPRHSDRLADAWGGPVERARFPGFGHNDVGMHPGYDASIRAFLDRCL